VTLTDFSYPVLALWFICSFIQGFVEQGLTENIQCNQKKNVQGILWKPAPHKPNNYCMTAYRKGV
jgi:hypothetical protein